MVSYNMRPQDVALLLHKLHEEIERKQMLSKDLATLLRLSSAEVSTGLRRLEYAQLLQKYGPKEWHVQRMALVEFLEYGLPYTFPVIYGRVGVGVATGVSAPPFDQKIISTETWVWAHPEGTARGSTVVPLYPTLVEVALINPKLHSLYAAAEIFRIGGAREKQEARIFFKELATHHSNA